MAKSDCLIRRTQFNPDDVATTSTTTHLPYVDWNTAAWGKRSSGTARLYLEDWKPLSPEQTLECMQNGVEFSPKDADPRGLPASKEQKTTWLEIDGSITSPDSMVKGGDLLDPGLRVWSKTLTEHLACANQTPIPTGTIELATAVSFGGSSFMRNNDPELDEGLFAGLIVYQDKDRYFAFGRRGTDKGEIVAYVREPGKLATEVIPIPLSGFSPAGTSYCSEVTDPSGQTKQVTLNRPWQGDFWIRLQLTLKVNATSVQAHWLYGYDAKTWRQDDQCCGNENLQGLATIADLEGVDPLKYQFGKGIDPSKAHI